MTRVEHPVNIEEQREGVNALRFLGGLMLTVALLLFFFHLAESPLGRNTLGILAAVFAALGALLLALGQRKMRQLR
jgi:hypothetical protein